MEILELTPTENAFIDDAADIVAGRVVIPRAPDMDPLLDPRRVGERITDGFRILAGGE